MVKESSPKGWYDVAYEDGFISTTKTPPMISILKKLKVKPAIKPVTKPEVAEVAILSTQEQKDKIHIIARDKGISNTDYVSLAKEVTGKPSSAQMTYDEATEFIDRLMRWTKSIVKPKDTLAFNPKDLNKPKSEEFEQETDKIVKREEIAKHI